MQPQVEDKFNGYNIIAAINVKQDGRDLWFITGESQRDFLNVSVEEGVMSNPTKVKRYGPKPASVKGRDN